MPDHLADDASNGASKAEKSAQRSTALSGFAVLIIFLFLLTELGLTAAAAFSKATGVTQADDGFIPPRVYLFGVFAIVILLVSSRHLSEAFGVSFFNTMRSSIPSEQLPPASPDNNMQEGGANPS